MSEKDETGKVEETRNVDRRELLRAIGAALAVASTGGAVVEALAQTKPTSPAAKLPPVIDQPAPRAVAPVRLSPEVKLAPKDGVYSVFYATPPNSTVASVVVVNQGNPAGAQQIARTLGGSPATARVVNGVINVDLGRAAAGRCWINKSSLGLGVAAFQSATTNPAAITGSIVHPE